MNLESVLARFERRQAISGGFMVRCPAHDDQKASLSISSGQDGRVLLHCHAGCSVDAILARLGLAAADLFDKPLERQEEVAYDYKDETGALLFQVVRRPGKQFPQRRPDGNGGWLWKLGDCRRVLYRLPELKGKAAVVIVEGEKDANRLWSIGMPATTNPGGAGKWRPEFADQLKVAGVQRVVVLPDNDPPGDMHARAVGRSCHDAGLFTKVILLEGLPAKGDVSDYLDKHNKGELLAVIKNAPPFNPASHLVSHPLALELTSLSQLLSEPEEAIEWLVEDRIPGGSLILLAGKPKAGKSTIARALAFSVATGERWLGHHVTRGPVWYLALEDKRSEIRRHFRMMGAQGHEPIWVLVGEAPSEVMGLLEARAAAEKPALIIVDTLQRLIRAKDMSDYAEVTTRFAPLLKLSRDTGAALVCVHHANKFGEGLDCILGSTALAGSVDNVFILGRGERDRTLTTIQRIGPDLEATVVELDPDTGHVTLSCAKRDADAAACGKQILELLAGQADAVTERWIREQIEWRPQEQARALRLLLRQGAVTRTGKGHRGDPYLWKLAQERQNWAEPENPTENKGLNPNAPNSFSGSGTYVRNREPERSERTPVRTQARSVQPPALFVVPSNGENGTIAPLPASASPSAPITKSGSGGESDADLLSRVWRRAES